MNLKETAGIYQILNKHNLKCYVGSTRRRFSQRFYDHKRDLKNNKHHSKHLQAAWNKYGEEVFEFTVLEIIDKSLDKIYFLQREQYI
jgi:group I intron endonuclease